MQLRDRLLDDAHVDGLATWLVSYHFPVQIAPTGAGQACTILARGLFDGLPSPHDQTVTSMTATQFAGTTGGVTNLLAFPNVTPGTHQIALQLFASNGGGCVSPFVTHTSYFAGTWGSNFTVAFLNQ